MASLAHRSACLCLLSRGLRLFLNSKILLGSNSIFPYTFFLTFWVGVSFCSPPCLSQNSLCRPGWPWALRDPPASASPECWYQRCVLPPGSADNLCLDRLGRMYLSDGRSGFFPVAWFFSSWFVCEVRLRIMTHVLRVCGNMSVTYGGFLFLGQCWVASVLIWGS